MYYLSEQIVYYNYYNESDKYLISILYILPNENYDIITVQLTTE